MRKERKGKENVAWRYLIFVLVKPVLFGEVLRPETKEAEREPCGCQLWGSIRTSWASIGSLDASPFQGCTRMKAKRQMSQISPTCVSGLSAETVCSSLGPSSSPRFLSGTYPGPLPCVFLRCLQRCIFLDSDSSLAFHYWT